MRTYTGAIMDEVLPVSPASWQPFFTTDPVRAMKRVNDALEVRGRRTMRDVLTDLLEDRDPYVREAAMLRLGDA